ncbi:hypothetical protein [Arthrobacter sp. CG_A4]|uniref:hypothetical protein n=1 Tax=Arthrobacter sp. CG_A4 TaxID=3071706 RepID=UPI002E047994|nr:hypothetical protein [Arthrobacter sp. CG_A4]
MTPLDKNIVVRLWRYQMALKYNSPTAAVTKASGRSPKARKTRGANGQKKLLQKRMSR